MDIDIEKLIDEHFGKIEDKVIDWFNIESIVDDFRMQYNLDTKYSYKVENYLEKRLYKYVKEKTKKELVSPSDINIVSMVILQKIASVYKGDISKNELENITFNIGSGSKNHVTKSLNYFEAHELIKRDKEGKLVFYKLDPKDWFKKSDYEINDISIIEKIIPLIIAYVKTGNFKDFNIQKLFEHLSEIIDFAIKPSIYHSHNLDVEIAIVETIENNKDDENPIDTLEIKRVSQKESEFIIPKKISFDSNYEKFITVDIVDDNYNVLSSNIEIPLADIKLVDSEVKQLPVVKPVNSSDFNPLLALYKTYYDEPINIQSTSESEIVIEADPIVYDYYKIKPLSNQRVFETRESLIEFTESTRIPINDSKFYITAIDDKEKILSTVLHTLNHVKIIHPKELNDELVDRFKKYADKAGVDCCDEPLKNEDDNTNNNPSSDEGVSSPESSNTVKKSKNSNEEINKMLNRWAEDDLKNNTFLP